VKISSVEAFRIAGSKDYVAAAGLRAPARPKPAGRARALRANSGRHLCVYPSQAETTLVKVSTDEGVVGIGEAHAPPVASITRGIVDDLLGPILIGEDPLQIEVLWEKMYSSMRLRGHNTGFMLEAIAGVDIALWDLAGKALGQPIYRLLGGPFRESIPVYASGVPGATVEERVAAVRRFVGQGYGAIKASVGRGDVDDDLEVIRILAEAVRGEADLLVDAHGAYDVATAVRAGRLMESWGVYWLEDALCPEDVSGYAALCQALDLAIAAGETVCTRYQFRDWLERRAVDVILPDVCRAGGISEGRKIANLADTYGVPWCAHVSIGSAVHLAAALHLAAATPNFLICEYPSTPNPLGDALLRAPLAPVGGQIRLPEGPGLGIEFDEEALAAHRID